MRRPGRARLRRTGGPGARGPGRRGDPRASPEPLRGNPTGAGDAVVAALAAGMSRGAAPAEVLAEAVAWSAAAVLHPWPDRPARATSTACGRWSASSRTPTTRQDPSPVRTPRLGRTPHPSPPQDPTPPPQQDPPPTPPAEPLTPGGRRCSSRSMTCCSRRVRPAGGGGVQRHPPRARRGADGRGRAGGPARRAPDQREHRGLPRLARTHGGGDEVLAERASVPVVLHLDHAVSEPRWSTRRSASGSPR